jgi:hypothetical protein
MAFPEFDSFRAELSTVIDAVDRIELRTLRDENLRERLRTLFRSWTSSVQPIIRGRVKNTRDLFKLTAELEKIAQLTSKCKPVAEYRRRLNTATQLANILVLSVPLLSTASSAQRQELFLPGIPDLPIALVPDPLIGYQSKMKEFLQRHPFDRSVFIMIRYRTRNNRLIAGIKSAITESVIDGRPFFPLLASEHNLTDDLYNPIACLLCSSLGVAVFDRREAGEIYNPNVAYELGMMHLLGRPCLLLKHESLGFLQTDILMKLYKPYSGPVNAGAVVAAWEPLTPREN